MLLRMAVVYIYINVFYVYDIFMVNTGETKINDTYLLASEALGKISGRA